MDIKMIHFCSIAFWLKYILKELQINTVVNLIKHSFVLAVLSVVRCPISKSLDWSCAGPISWPPRSPDTVVQEVYFGDIQRVWFTKRKFSRKKISLLESLVSLKSLLNYFLSLTEYSNYYAHACLY